MTSDLIFEGGCLCGRVRYIATGQPQATAICHCRSCQKAMGAESVGWACFQQEQVSWKGESRKKYESSNDVERCFCGRCGTSLSYQATNNTLDISMASLDDPEALNPEREVYLSHRMSRNF